MESSEKRIGGRLILSGMISRFVGLALFIIGMFLHYRMDYPKGESVSSIGEVFVALWIPLVLMGAIVRLAGPKEPASSLGSGEEEKQ